MQSSEHDVLEAGSGFINTFSSSVEDNELYYLSQSVPAMPGIAKEILEAQVISRKDMKDCTDSHLDFRKYVGFHKPIKCNKLKTLAACKLKKKLTS